MMNIAAINSIPEAGLDLIRNHPQMKLSHQVKEDDRDRIRDALAEADGVIIGVSRLDEDILKGAVNLKVVARLGVGYDSIDVGYLSKRGICLFITGDTNSRSVAEHALYMLLSLAKRGHLYDRATRNGNWAFRNRYESAELFGKTALVVGFGRIGRTVASLFAAIGMKVMVSDEYLDRDAAIGLGYQPVDDVRATLPAADVVTFHIPMTPEARGFIGAPELAAMKSSAFVLNLSRGGIIDEHALAAALAAGTIAGAGIDVFSTEPVPANHPLLQAPNLVLSPHSAGLTAEGSARTGVAAANNIIQFFNGTPQVECIVNADVWRARAAVRP